MTVMVTKGATLMIVNIWDKMSSNMHLQHLLAPGSLLRAAYHELILLVAAVDAIVAETCERRPKKRKERRRRKKQEMLLTSAGALHPGDHGSVVC
jgi:hypothetical protein